jgi:hypothetical protein
VPEGWELLAIRRPETGEYVMDGYGNPCRIIAITSEVLAIIRKIEIPKFYRPFANAEEFKPHRDRWARRISDGLVFRCTSYGGGALVVLDYILPSFAEAFQRFVFDDDGTPFGVEVIE